MKRAIEDSFPIVEINKLAIPERSSFKPIYQMHKWFARRASCVFRAILLGAMKPAGTDIMADFYKDHSNDPDTNGIRILDPFMGGGTTVIEALRLGCKVTGIDLNPIAWFIVKTEAEKVDIDELKAAFKRLEKRITITGKPLKEELLSHYKTTCPCCGGEADIIYTFWVKMVTCADQKHHQVPLISSHIISQKNPSIRYTPDFVCSKCSKTFDLEHEIASLVAKPELMLNSGKDSAGEGRANKRWAAYNETNGGTTCPWCEKQIAMRNLHGLKKARKKVPLNVLLCPSCNSICQFRGSMPEMVACPTCKKEFDPQKGYLPDKKYECPTCGVKESVIDAIRKMPDEQLLPIKAYAIEGWCPNCDGGGESDDDNSLFKESNTTPNVTSVHSCSLKKHGGKFFKKIEPSDIRNHKDADVLWSSLKSKLPYPKSKIPSGFNTNQMIKHNYIFWFQMFNQRQLLCLSILLKAIDDEPNQSVKEMFLSAFQMSLEANNMFARYRANSGGRSPFGGLFARHDYQPKATPCEINVFGPYSYYGTFIACVGKVFEGKKYNIEPFDSILAEDRTERLPSKETFDATGTNLLCLDSTAFKDGLFDLTITDPPYAGNVNYSELADFFYVWLRLVLRQTYPWFAPDYTPKVEEIVENETRGKTAEEYQAGLTKVWQKCHKSMSDNSLLVFTFHHAEDKAWEALLESICAADFYLQAVYPIHGESETSMQLMDKQAISYDLIHVCRKRLEKSDKKVSWAGIRQEIRRKAREEIKLIESGRYGKDRLSEADINMVLIGKCLQYYSIHYGNIIDYKGDTIPLREALTSIRMMVEQFVSSTNPLPSELEHIDPISYVYLTCLCDRTEIKVDEVSKAIRGLIEPEALLKENIMKKGRAGRGRTYEVKKPSERADALDKLFGGSDERIIQTTLFPEMEEERFDRIPLVNVLHHLMNIAASGENLVPWLSRFKPVMPQIRAAMEYAAKRNATFQEPIRKVLNLLEV